MWLAPEISHTLFVYSVRLSTILDRSTRVRFKILTLVYLPTNIALTDIFSFFNYPTYFEYFLQSFHHRKLHNYFEIYTRSLITHSISVLIILYNVHLSFNHRTSCTISTLFTLHITLVVLIRKSIFLYPSSSVFHTSPVKTRDTIQ